MAKYVTMATEPRTARGQRGEPVAVGMTLLGHGLVTGVSWPLGTCLSCGCLVNAETGEGHQTHYRSPGADVATSDAAAQAQTQRGEDQADEEWWVDHFIRGHMSGLDGLEAAREMAIRAEDYYAATGREYPLPKVDRS